MVTSSWTQSKDPSNSLTCLWADGEASMAMSGLKTEVSWLKKFIWTSFCLSSGLTGEGSSFWSSTGKQGHQRQLENISRQNIVFELTILDKLESSLTEEREQSLLSASLALTWEKSLTHSDNNALSGLICATNYLPNCGMMKDAIFFKLDFMSNFVGLDALFNQINCIQS